MRLTLVALALVFVAASVHEVRSLTNKEFYQMLDADGDFEALSAADDENDIVLHGGPNDLVDFEDVIKQLGMGEMIEALSRGEMMQDADDLDINEAVTEEEFEENAMTSTDLDLDTDLEGGSCRCSGTTCNCCYSKRFKIWFKRFTVKVCAHLSYSGGAVHFSLTLNNRTVYRKSIRRSLTVCYKVPHTFGLARACAQIYNLNIGRRSFCIKLYARAGKYRVTFVRRCMRLSSKTAGSLGY